MIKIISHNVNGINAYKNAGKLDELLKFNADVYCLQEVRCGNEEKLKTILGGEIYDKYEVISNLNSDIKRYAGVVTLLSKETMGKVLLSIDTPEFTSPNLTNYSKGRILTLYFTNCILINLYAINSVGQKQNERIAYDQMLNVYIKKLKQDFHLPIILVGELNVCTSQLDYSGDFEKDYNVGPSLYDFEIDAFNNLVGANKLIDSYRCCNLNEQKYSANMKIKRKEVAARTDYILVDSRIQKNIGDATIHEDFSDKDHKPIETNINLPYAYR